MTTPTYNKISHEEKRETVTELAEQILNVLAAGIEKNMDPDGVLRKSEHKSFFELTSEDAKKLRFDPDTAADLVLSVLASALISSVLDLQKDHGEFAYMIGKILATVSQNHEETPDFGQMFPALMVGYLEQLSTEESLSMASRDPILRYILKSFSPDSESPQKYDA